MSVWLKAKGDGHRLPTSLFSANRKGRAVQEHLFTDMGEPYGSMQVQRNEEVEGVIPVGLNNMLLEVQGSLPLHEPLQKAFEHSFALLFYFPLALFTGFVCCRVLPLFLFLGRLPCCPADAMAVTLPNEKEVMTA